MRSNHKMISVPLDVLEAALEELPEGSAAAVRILKALEETPSREPVAYLAQRRDGKQGGKFFATKPGRHYDPQLYRGPIPVYEGPVE
ncbi:hypothetical protein [Pseudomonas sp. NBRC 111124]|uniref:hypothetical protein n=1 Tax=Pseudomonas sp. NBRC 111124 TaxID=1661039 RepID=UPI000761CA2A|nr:hypothetical protein [Pseudomonas sp. NBRC 111124]